MSIKTKKINIKSKNCTHLELESDSDLEEIVSKLNSIILRSNQINQKITDLEIMHGKQKSLDIIRTSPLTQIQISNQSINHEKKLQFSSSSKKPLRDKKSSEKSSSSNSFILAQDHKKIEQKKLSKRPTGTSISKSKTSIHQKKPAFHYKNVSHQHDLSKNSNVISQILDVLNELKSEMHEISQNQIKMQTEIEELQLKYIK